MSSENLQKVQLKANSTPPPNATTSWQLPCIQSVSRASSQQFIVMRIIMITGGILVVIF